MSQKPTRIVLNTEPSLRTPSQGPQAGPRAVVFPANKAPTEALAVSQRAPASVSTSAPGALIFPPSAPSVAMPRPSSMVGMPLFAQAAHPLLDTALHKANTASPELVAANDNRARLERILKELLPLKTPVIETFAHAALDQCRRHAFSAAALGKRHIELRGGDRLQAAVTTLRPATGFKDKLKKILQSAAEANPHAQLSLLRLQLVELLHDTRKAVPEALADGERLALRLLALRSVVEASGRALDTALEFALQQRLETLRAAALQAQLVSAQLKLTEDTASLQLVECDRLANVTLTAVALARANA